MRGLDDLSPHDAAGLLKQLLRSLPSPLLSSDYQESFLQVDSEHCLFLLYICQSLLMFLVKNASVDLLPNIAFVTFTL